MTHPRNLARLNYYRQRVDRSTELMQLALDVREQLHWGLDLDHAAELVEHFKRGVAAYRQSGS